MAYTPKTWECGDTITAEELNRMEQGIAQGGGGDTIVGEDIKSSSETNVYSFKPLQVFITPDDAKSAKRTAIFADIEDISKVHFIAYNGVIRTIEMALLEKVTVYSPSVFDPGNYLEEDTEAWHIWLMKSPLDTSPSVSSYEEAFIFPTSTKVGVVSA